MFFLNGNFWEICFIWCSSGVESCWIEEYLEYELANSVLFWLLDNGFAAFGTDFCWAVLAAWGYCQAIHHDPFHPFLTTSWSGYFCFGGDQEGHFLKWGYPDINHPAISLGFSMKSTNELGVSPWLWNPYIMRMIITHEPWLAISSHYEWLLATINHY